MGHPISISPVDSDLVNPLSLLTVEGSLKKEEIDQIVWPENEMISETGDSTCLMFQFLLVLIIWVFCAGFMIINRIPECRLAW